MKRKRVSFGGNLSPELFDKRLPSDSPLRRGAAPRRSLGVAALKESLLRRASAIGLLTEFQCDETCPASPIANESPKRSKTPSPKRTPVVKAKTPSPKRTPVVKAKTPSPKKTPVVKAKTSSPKKTPVVKAKTPTPKKTPVVKAKTPSPARGRSQPIDTPISKKTPSPRRLSTSAATSDSTPTVKGRFSVSRVDTPSPAAEQEAKSDPQAPAGTASTPRRKSTENSAKSTLKSSTKVLQRRSGVSRASMKMGSWADIVRFGQNKAKGVVLVKKVSAKGKAKRVLVPKPKTPGRTHKVPSLAEYTSTSHANSPVTIVVGKAHKRTFQSACAAAPRMVLNVVLLRKNMKMDEDLSGVAEMFSTPVSAKRAQPGSGTPSATNTPLRPGTAGCNETLGLNTPEETGEMVVSPLSVVSTATRGRYNSDALARFLREDQEASFKGCPSLEDEEQEDKEEEEESLATFPTDVHAVHMSRDQPSAPQGPDTTAEAASTPRRKPEQPDGLTGVKRIMKTPKQKPTPLEDLRGKLLKTPRQQKPEHPDGLTGVKRIMKTPKQKPTPVEDLRGKLLKTPRVQRVCEGASLEGLKELLQTPPLEVKAPQQQPHAQERERTCMYQAEEVPCVSADAEPTVVTKETEVLCVILPEVLCPEEELSPVAEPEQPDVPFVEHHAEEDAMAEEPPCDVTAVGTAAVVPASVKRSTRGRKVPAREDSGTEGIAPAARSSATRRRKTTEPAVVKVPAEPAGGSVSPEEATPKPVSPKPRRGRKSKQEQTASVQEELRGPAKEEVPLQENIGSEGATASVEKPKRGRKSKQALADQTDVVVEDTAEALGEPGKEPRVPVRARRGRNAVQEHQENLETAATEIPTGETVDATEPVPKARRGRKLKPQDSEEKNSPDPQRDETPVPEKAESPTPVSKPTRGRKVAKQEPPSVKRAEAAEPSPPRRARRGATPGGAEAVVAAPPAPAEGVDVKPVRGRKAKPFVKEEEVVVEVEVPPTTPAKRGRRGAMESIQEAAAAAGEPTLTPAKSGARGRAVKPVEVSLGPVAKGRGSGRSSKNAAATETALEGADVPQAPAQAGRGRAKAAGHAAEPPARESQRSKKSVKWEANVEVQHAAKASPEAKAVGGKRASAAARATPPRVAKKACRAKVEPEETPKVAKKACRAKVEPEEAPKVAKKACRAKVEPEEAPEVAKKACRAKVEPEEAPEVAKKACRAKVEPEETPKVAKKACHAKVEPEEAPEVAVSKASSKRRATTSKAEDLNVEADVPVKRSRRGATATGAAPLEAAAGIEDPVDSISESRESAAPAKKGTRVPKKGTAVSKAPIKPEEQLSVRRGRTAAAKK